MSDSPHSRIKWAHVAQFSKLDLANCGLQTVPEEVAHVQQISNLNLSKNRLTSIGPVITLHKLTKLNLCCNRLGFIPPEVASLKYLQELNLSQNILQAFPHVLLELDQLRLLYIAHNRLTALPADLHRMRSLEHLSVSNNAIVEIPYSIKDMRLLRYLDVSLNQLERLPMSLCEMNCLETLLLDGNPLPTMPQSVLEKGADAIKRYLRDKISEADTLERMEQQVLEIEAKLATIAPIPLSDIATPTVRSASPSFRDSPGCCRLYERETRSPARRLFAEPEVSRAVPQITLSPSRRLDTPERSTDRALYWPHASGQTPQRSTAPYGTRDSPLGGTGASSLFPEQTTIRRPITPTQSLAQQASSIRSPMSTPTKKTLLAASSASPSSSLRHVISPARKPGLAMSDLSTSPLPRSRSTGSSSQRLMPSVTESQRLLTHSPHSRVPAEVTVEEFLRLRKMLTQLQGERSKRVAAEGDVERMRHRAADLEKDLQQIAKQYDRLLLQQQDDTEMRKQLQEVEESNGRLRRMMGSSVPLEQQIESAQSELYALRSSLSHVVDDNEKLRREVDEMKPLAALAQSMQDEIKMERLRAETSPLKIAEEEAASARLRAEAERLRADLANARLSIEKIKARQPY